MNPTLMQDLAATIAADRRREAERFRAAAQIRDGWARPPRRPDAAPRGRPVRGRAAGDLAGRPHRVVCRLAGSLILTAAAPRAPPPQETQRTSSRAFFAL